MPERKPNIVWIVSDQHRADWMGSEDASFALTPHLDRLADEGVRCTTAYCNSPLCVPSRMSMMTGQLPHRIGVWSNEDSLPSDRPTIAHALAMAGYETVLCGRMHFVGSDQRHGFQSRFVGDITPSYPGGPKVRYGHLEGTARQGIKSIELAGTGDSPVIDYDEAVASAYERYVANRSRRENQQPLFITVGFYSPHSPYVCPPENYELAANAVKALDLSDCRRESFPNHPWTDRWHERLGTAAISDELTARMRIAYAGLIHYMDSLVGRVLRATREHLGDDTVVVYVSDHGEMAGERGMFWKMSFFEGAVRVPMIWSYLGGSGEGCNLIRRGLVVHEPVSLLDLAPTFAELAGAPPLPNGSGMSLLPMLEEASSGNIPFRDRPLFSELFVNGCLLRMVRKGQYKLIFYQDCDPPVQLFDLAADPGERNDLSADPAYRSISDELLVMLLDNWDPHRIRHEVLRKQLDTGYWARWGREVGMGPLDLWQQPE